MLNDKPDNKNITKFVGQSVIAARHKCCESGIINKIKIDIIVINQIKLNTFIINVYKLYIFSVQ